VNVVRAPPDSISSPWPPSLSCPKGEAEPGIARRSDNPRRCPILPALDDVSPFRAPVDRTRRSRGSDNRPSTHAPEGLTPVPPGTPSAAWRRSNGPAAAPGARSGQSAWSTRTAGQGPDASDNRRQNRVYLRACAASADSVRTRGRCPKLRRMRRRPRSGPSWPIFGDSISYRTRHRPRIGQWHIAQIGHWGRQGPRCEEIRSGLW
jgi:hypothetical protein